MTDLEKAIQKAKSYDTEYSEDFQFDEVLKDPLRFIQDYPKILYLLLKEKHYRDGYLDGLAEGKPKWHEIKYCSQDLPPRSKDNHLHSVIVSNEYGEPIYYDYNIDEWCDMEGDVVSEGYKYWCELPKFEE